MATFTQPLSCQQKYKKMVSHKAMIPVRWKGPRYSDELPPLTLPVSSHKRNNKIESISSKLHQFSQETHDDFIKIKRCVHERGQQSSSNTLRDDREAKQKKRSNRDSIFSFMSIISKNEDRRPIERKATESKEEVTSPVYSQVSFLSSSSTIDIPSQVKSEKINNSSNELASARVSMTQSRSSISSPIKMSTSFKGSVHIKDVPKRTSSQLRSDKCQKNSDKIDSETTNSVLESDTNCLDFFQEQQEQEYRIAKAWLEAEESRKTSPSTSRGAIKSGSTEYQWDDAWIKIPSSDNGWQTNKMMLKDNQQKVGAGHSHLRPKVIFDIDIPLDGDISTEYRVTSKTYSEKKQNNTKRKRISGMVNLAIGVRGWLSRRVRSN
ncbi:hypothetical protein OnM2_028078 [Erysiphe neolycopersici]|uniref:Uncharacterized protein n=1 Tax=Erysiphe neolycopersici TaxID=212602 RepID=A0A420I011_9PEZI|nr:hypothetical protein OnM2_028078 [Erysiphe neolycopersici]